MTPDAREPDRPRPSPEEFLRLIARDEPGRGRLKVYLGAAAGVGKTWAMLDEGNRLRESGVDVVIGYVEAHDRPATTARIGALEVVPPLLAPLGGMTAREMDLDAVLRRKPAVALVDELAHTNAPGSRHAKRYEDIAALREAGITVITTVNIQHLESLHDIVAAATGVEVRERVPDSVVAGADQVVHIDLPAEDLIERLKAGKIYPADRIAPALQNFFTPRNLSRLREIALSEGANFLDRAERRFPTAETKPGTSARVLVAVSSRGPHPEALLRKAARLAERLNTPEAWYAVYVRTPGEAPARVTAETHRRLVDTLDLAQKMGGTVVVLKETDVAAALGKFARERGITHAVLGRPGPRPWWRRFRPALVERASAALPGVDLVLG